MRVMLARKRGLSMSIDYLSEAFKTQADYKRQHGQGFEVIPMTGDDVSDLIELAVNTARQSGVTRYEYSERGLEAFMQRSMQYLEYIKGQNENADSEDSARLIPSIESWAVFMGLSRVTILQYEKQRNDSWRDFIGFFKNTIQACRGQLTDRGKLPVVANIFSAINSNAGYVNSSAELKVNGVPEQEVIRSSSETPESIQERYRSRLADLQEIDGNN